MVLKPKEILSGRGGSYYGNIGRCLFFQGDFENAQICLIKSASSLEKERNELMLLNQGYAGLWLGEFQQQGQAYTSRCSDPNAPAELRFLAQERIELLFRLAHAASLISFSLIARRK